MVNPDGTGDNKINIAGLPKYRSASSISSNASRFMSTAISSTTPQFDSDNSDFESVLYELDSATPSEEEDVDMIGALAQYISCGGGRSKAA